MTNGIMKCRICGKEYEACRNSKRINGVFRWQDVACCVEHGAEYLAQIRASRAGVEASATPSAVDEAYAFLDTEYDEVEIEDEVLDDDSDDDIEIEV